MGYDTDDAVVRELTLFIENDGDLYRRRGEPWINSIARKMKRGNYNKELAIKGIAAYYVKDGVKKYQDDFADSNFKVSKKDREAIAKNLLPGLEESAQYKLANGQRIGTGR